MIDELTLWTIEAILALSLVLVWGRGGIFSLGQSGLFGLAAYAHGVVTANLVDSGWSLIVGLFTGSTAAAVMALLVGYFMFYGRVSQVNVAIITLATTLVLFALFNNTADPRYHIGDAVLGGSNGMIGIPPPQIGETVLTPEQMLGLVAALAVLCAAGVALLLRRPFGRVATAIRSNEERTELLGFDIRARQLALFVIGAAIAGLAGALFAAWGSFVDPSVFALQAAIMVVIWAIVGGRIYVAGAFAGAIGVEALDHYLGGNGGEWTPVYLGAALIVVVLLLPGGIVGGLSRLVDRLRGRATRGHDDSGRERLHLAHAPPAKVLNVEAVSKRFGGMLAVDGVDMAFKSRGLHCIIGPNGAGKSTLFAMLTGRHRPTQGRVVLDGRDITKLPPHRRAGLGIGIKLQGVSLFSDLSVRENLWLAAYAATGSRREADFDADSLIRSLGLSAVAFLPADELSHGEQQWLDIGMVIARRPSVVLLDEPTAGMTVSETEETADLVKEIAEQASVVVIEHDMAFIRALSAPVTVMHLGAVLVEGQLADVERDDRVLDVYLGHSHVAA